MALINKRLHEAANMIFESAESRDAIDAINGICETRANELDFMVRDMNDKISFVRNFVRVLPQLEENIVELFPDSTRETKETSIDYTITYRLKNPLVWNDDEFEYENGMMESDITERILRVRGAKQYYYDNSELNPRLFDIDYDANANEDIFAVKIIVDLYKCEEYTNLSLEDY